ncbi:MT-A70 family methyltransferase [Thalassobaculum litoreum]|uniref:N6-adenosine-specific RNA methylase IME4 n=2 Tax=Thalassobaculum litoreum DSM 18839 TaxID=1123362 RepID=A0A8G2EX62_9PROT|nr:MT-A70 family methyltransferase [Thalassobaculum litoreum]SDG55301.1 N6-adenosine-specific RNA methylase IME4 [Thalassobaculum litoreum DSM 18839]
MIDLRDRHQLVRHRRTGGYPVILADPNWPFDTHSEKGQGKSPSRHYDTMSIGEICSVDVSLLAAKDATLFLWVTWPHMPSWTRVIEAWGFEYAGLAWEWRKYNPETGKYAFGPGYGTRKNLEPCLLCTRGNPQLRKPTAFFGDVEIPEGVHSVRDFIDWWPHDEIRSPRRGHSQKPPSQYERIETLFDGPYLELFARNTRPGWKSLGDEVAKFGEVG